MKEIWKRWEPTDGLQSKYYIDFIRDDIESGLVIKLSSQDEREIIINWDGVVDSYMCSEESTRSILYEDNELVKWTFFKVKNSKYLQWVQQQSLGIQQCAKLCHYSIIGINSVIDIAASYDPVIEVFTKG